MRDLSCFALIALFVSSARADVIELRSGERIEDEVLSYDGTTFTLKGRGKVPASDVKEVKFISGGAVHATEKDLPKDAWDVQRILDRAKVAKEAFPDVEGIVLLDDGAQESTADGKHLFRYHFLGLVSTRKTIDWANVAVNFEEERERVRIPLARSIAPDGTIAAADPSSVQMAEEKGESTSFGRSKIATLVVPKVQVGSIVEYIYEKETFDPFDKNIFDVDWSFQGEQPYWESMFRVTIPEGKELNYTSRLMPPGTEKAAVETKEGKTTYTWRLTKRPAVAKEPSAPDVQDLVPRVAGSLFKDWTYLDQWAAGLEKQRMVATPELKKKVEELTAGAKDEDEKIARLYHWNQREVRYISIKGSMSSGWSGHPAAETLANGYGDCIDKSILFSTMLGVIGVEAYPVSIKTNDKETAIRDIPFLDANHAITEVHRNGKISYLDPTHTDYRYPYFRSDDHGVTAVNEITGKINTIECPPPDWNWNAYEVDATLDEKGNAKVHVVAKYQGDYEAGVRAYWRSVAEEERPKQFEQYVAKIAPGAKLIKFEIINLDDLSKQLAMDYTYEARRFWTEAGPVRILEVPGLSYDFKEVSLPKRQYPIKYETTKRTTHHVVIHLPKGFQVKALPDAADLGNATPYAAYSGAYKQEDGAIEFTDDFERKAQLVPVKDYDAYRGFCEGVAGFTEQKMFLIHEEH